MAAFADEVKSVQFLGNQESTEILGKLTQRIQVTDTDFARSFKSRFRKQLDQFRRDHRNTGSSKLYHVDYYDIIRGVVAAEDELRSQKPSKLMGSSSQYQEWHLVISPRSIKRHSGPN